MGQAPTFTVDFLKKAIEGDLGGRSFRELSDVERAHTYGNILVQLPYLVEGGDMILTDAQEVVDFYNKTTGESITWEHLCGKD